MTMDTQDGRHVQGLLDPLCKIDLLHPLLCTPTPTPTPPACAQQPYAVFAQGTLLPLTMAGVGDIVQGPVHSNKATWMVGVNENIMGRDEAPRFLTVGLTENAGQRVTTTGTQDFPEARLTADSFGTPTFSFKGDVDLALVPSVWAAPGKLKPGVYRSTGRILLTVLDTTGNVTFVAKGVSLLGVGMTLTPYAQGVLAFSDGHLLSRDIEVGALENHLSGKLLAYDGAVLYAGVHNVLQGSVYAKNFVMAGTLNRISAPLGAGCSPTPTPPVETPTPAPSSPGAGLPTPVASPLPSPTPTPPVVTATPTSTPNPGASPTSLPSGTNTPPPGPTEPSGSTWSIEGFGNIFGLAFNSQGSLWASATGMPAHGVQFDGHGNQQGATELGIDAWGVAVQESTGRIWYTDKGSCQVTVLNADRSVAFTVGMGEASLPEGIVFDKQGNPWITDYGNNVVDELDPNSGNIVAQYPVGTGPRGITCDDAGNLWVTNYLSDTVMTLSTDGTIQNTMAVGSGPSCVQVAPDKTLWVSNTGPDIPYPDGFTPGTTVQRLSATGAALGSVSVGNSPFGLTFDQHGNVLVVNTGDDSVSKLSPDGLPLATFPTGHHPYNIAVDRQGYAWVANHDDGTLTKLVP